MMTLVYDERVFRNGRRVDLVCVEEVDELGRGFGGRSGWGETDVVSCGSRCGLEGGGSISEGRLCSTSGNS